MGRRTRSSNSASSKKETVDIKIEEVPVACTADTEVDIDFDIMDEITNQDIPPTIKEEQVVVKTEPITSATPVAEYEEDIIDYDDDDLAPAGSNSDDTLIGIEDEDIKLEGNGISEEPREAAEVTEKTMTEEQAEIEAAERVAAEERLVRAKFVMSLGPQTLLTKSSDMANALQLNAIGDAVTVNISANGVNYEVTWKVAGMDESQPQGTIEQCAALATTPQPAALTVDTTQRKTSSLRDAAPLSGSTPSASHLTTKCKYGKWCTKGAACPFDHTIKLKLCTWINTAQGCTKGEGCDFSHENEGTKCTRSSSRFTCANGRGCAFKHHDDVRRAPVPKSKAVAPPALAQQTEAVDPTPPANTPNGPKASSSPLPNAPKGPETNGTAPQLSKGAGQKRGRDEEDEAGKSVQRPKLHHDSAINNHHRGVKQHRGRGRGNGSGRGRGRGGAGVVAGAGELKIRGAAAGGQ